MNEIEDIMMTRGVSLQEFRTILCSILNGSAPENVISIDINKENAVYHAVPVTSYSFGIRKGKTVYTFFGQICDSFVEKFYIEEFQVVREHSNSKEFLQVINKSLPICSRDTSCANSFYISGLSPVSAPQEDIGNPLCGNFPKEDY